MNQRTAIMVTTGSARLSSLALAALAASELFDAKTAASVTNDPDGSGFKKTLGAADKFQASGATNFGLGKDRLVDIDTVHVHQPVADTALAAGQFTAKHRTGASVAA